MEEIKQTRTNPYMVPGAIVIAGAFIAGAVLFGNVSGTQNVANTGNTQPVAQKQAEPEDTTSAVRKVTAEDHIRGDINAPVTIVEYSDFECPFCKRFHDTMNQILDEEESGDVAWVYRHFPLDQLHPIKAKAEAVATECAAEQGGNDAFWKFADRFMELTPSNNRTDIDTVLPQIAKEIGLDVNEFQACLGSGKYDEHIQDDIENAIETGGRGTPWSIVITASGKTLPLNGAQPLAAIKQLIEIAKNDK